MPEARWRRAVAGRAAFTLIELILATAAGAVVIVAAAAALRVAAQTATTGERLATQNALIAAGLRGAFDELDFWTAYDDPLDPARQGLRYATNAVVAPGGMRRLGLPFAPFSATWPRVASADPEAVEGWDDDAPWDAADPRAWWRGTMAERLDSDLRHGRYALFGSCTSPMTLAGYGVCAPAHTWLPRQMRGLKDALGFYGLCEYLPPNAIYSVITGEAADGATTPGGIAYEWVRPGGWLANGSGNCSNARGLESLSFGSSFPMHPPQANPAWSGLDLLQTHRRHVLTASWFTDTATLAAFVDTTTARQEIMPLQPASWPKVEVAVTRSMMLRRFLALCRVRWSDPTTGDRAELAFCGFGSTLRGARRQRGLDAP
ncbi:MAG TPA: hypothetical protein VEL07_01305 [Planctomycetota bacterium]|nr:hypothetical protein [Planctomycetota bacterium]